MKKIISKILIIFIVVVMMFEFILSSNVCNASGDLENFINGATNLAGGILNMFKPPMFYLLLVFIDVRRILHVMFHNYSQQIQYHLK